MDEETLEFNYRKPFTYKVGDLVITTKITKYLDPGAYCRVAELRDSIVTKSGELKIGNYYCISPIRAVSKKYVVSEGTITYAPPVAATKCFGDKMK